MNNSPILVTGSHRSGSTWVGQMLASAPGVGYIHEPFNVKHRAGICRIKWDYWFQYVCQQNEAKYRDHIQQTLNFNYYPIRQLLAIRRRRDPIHLVRDFRDFRKYRRENARPLVKDPIAFFSAEWLAERFDMRVIVLIRHPAAFVGSLKKMNWGFDFSNFLNQPLLLKDHLAPFESLIRKYTTHSYDLIDQAILLWNIIHYVVLKYRDRHPDWIFIRHEDLSFDPVKEFATLFKRLKLQWSPDIQKKIDEYTNSNNPGDQTKDNDEFFKRNSRLNIWNWKRRLTEAEIFRIRMNTQSIAREFYSEEDWGADVTHYAAPSFVNQSQRDPSAARV